MAYCKECGSMLDADARFCSFCGTKIVKNEEFDKKRQYVLAMMALADNGAEKDFILSIRDAMRPNLIGHHYDNRDEFYSKYKTEAYRWIENMSKIQNEEC